MEDNKVNFKENNILENLLIEKSKKFGDIEKNEVNNLQQVLDHKLSLRKQKFNEILHKKRMTINNNNNNSNSVNINFTLLFNANKLCFPNNYKLDGFESKEYLLKTCTQFMKSKNIIDVKYSIYLLQDFVNQNMDINLTCYLNLSFIYDLLMLIKNWIKDKEIVFNILFILIGYSYINTKKELATVLLSPQAYNILEQCFDIQNYEIFYAMMVILGNIIYENQIGSCNLIRSDFLNKKIINFYLNNTILSKLNEITDKNNIYYGIIENGIRLFCSLLVTKEEGLDHITIEEILNYKQIIMRLILLYSKTNSSERFQRILSSIDFSTEIQPRLFDVLENSDLFKELTIDKKFFEKDKIRNYTNKIIGNYIVYKYNNFGVNLSDEILEIFIKYEIDSFYKYENVLERKEIFWVLSNIITGNDKVIIYFFQDDNFIKDSVDCYEKSVYAQEIEQMTYFFASLISKCNFNQFLKIQKYHLMEIAIDHAKTSFEGNTLGLLIILDLLIIFFEFGQYAQEKLNGRNVVIDVFNRKGGKELLNKYINDYNPRISEKVGEIIERFYK